MSELKLPEINRIVMSGRLTRDPEKRYASDGTPVTSFSLAFHRRYRTRDGKASEQTGYVTVMCYQRLAEVCAQFLHTGSPVLIEGRLQMREWASTRGEKRQTLELRAESVHFLEKAPSSGTPLDEASEDPTS
ncbi:MAG: single-stranded DNA-binding protein [Candidatus Eisenbacteria bacterium]